MREGAPGVKIRVLDEETVNQIAAGEVVERPASVVKELVENAVDAGADIIRVEIVSDARMITMIRVADNGSGMEKEEAVLAFTRHATSKIVTIEDLPAVRTMGFRGEALATIAAVSSVTMVTKRCGSGANPATEVQVRGGEILGVRETGAAEGTSVVVEDLFFNTPARKKFLRSRGTELKHVYAIMEQVALAHPDISFRVVTNGKERIATHATGEIHETIAALFGASQARTMIPVHCRLPYMAVEGYISPPAEDRSNAQHLYISINFRQITSASLNRAVRKGYGTLLAKNRYPFAALSLLIDTDLVDVNVHPTKREVRISRDREVHSDLENCIREALQKRSLIPGREEENRHVDPQLPLGGYTPSRGAMRVESPSVAYVPVHRALTTTDAQLRLTERSSVEEKEGGIPLLEVIGQLDASYILARTVEEETEELVIVDQHAAHERVLYEQVRAKREAGIRSQELIVPVILTLTPKEAAAVREALHHLMSEGFVLEEFGQDSFAVRTVPVALGTELGPQTVRDLISDLIEEELRSSTEQKERITTIIACRGAIKAGTVLTTEQMTRLLSQLAKTDVPFTCPHGRPTMVSFSRTRLDALFRRT